MEGPGYIAIVLSICIPLATGTCCFVLLGVLALRHHQQYRDEMLALRLEANERAERFAATYGYNTFATPIRFTSPAWGRDHPSVGSSLPRPSGDAGNGRTARDPGQRSASMPVNRLDLPDIQEAQRESSTESRTRLDRARRSSDPTSGSKDTTATSGEPSSSTGS